MIDPVSVPTRPLVKAPTIVYKVFRWNQFRKARKSVTKQLVCEALQLALFPHAQESNEAQHAADELWNAMQATTIRTEGVKGPFGRLVAKLDALAYGHFIDFTAATLDFRRTLALWVADALCSDRGRQLLDQFDLRELSRNEAKEIGELVSDILEFMASTLGLRDIYRVDEARLLLSDMLDSRYWRAALPIAASDDVRLDTRKLVRVQAPARAPTDAAAMVPSRSDNLSIIAQEMPGDGLSAGLGALQQHVQRLADVAGSVDEQNLQAALLSLESAVTIRAGMDVVISRVINVLDSLSE